MVRRDGAETRRDRIAQVAKTVHSLLQRAKDQGFTYISFSKVVSKLMYDTGLTKEKVIEYLRIIENAGQFEIDSENDKIYYPEVHCA